MERLSEALSGNKVSLIFCKKQFFIFEICVFCSTDILSLLDKLSRRRITIPGSSALPIKSSISGEEISDALFLVRASLKTCNSRIGRNVAVCCSIRSARSLNSSLCKYSRTLENPFLSNPDSSKN